jgi:hypothetical protein
VVAQGVSRGPMRATQQASSSAFYLERLAGSHGGSSANGSSNGARPASRDLGSGPAGGVPSASGNGPGPSPSGAGGAGVAAGGPAAVALGGVEVAQRLGNRVSRSADQATETGGATPRLPDRRGDAP